MNDTHVHSTFSFDGESRPEDVISFAEREGYDYLCFTEHFDPDYIKAGIPIPAFDPFSYYDSLLTITRDRDKGTVFGVGLEIGYDEVFSGELPPVDYVINSVHLVGGKDPYYEGFFDGRDKAEVYREYLLRVFQSTMASYSYDTVGHIGYISRYAPYLDKSIRFDEYRDVMDMILRNIISLGKSLEINTRGGIYSPDVSIFRRYVELGGESVTFGSDAHSVADVGRGYLETAELVKSLGLDYFSIYKDRYEVKMRIR